MKKDNPEKLKYEKEILIVILIILLLFGFLIYVFLFVPIYSKSVPVSFVVGNKIGMAINGTALDFGELIVNSTAYKTLKITNENSFPIIGKIYLEKTISDFVFCEDEIHLKGGEQKDLSVALKTGSEQGAYSGNLNIYFYRKAI